MLKPIIYVSWEMHYDTPLQDPADGCSFHLTEQDSEKYIRNYWKNMEDLIWTDYSKPIGLPIKALAGLKLYNLVTRFTEQLHGFRLDEESFQRAKETRELVLVGIK